MDVSITEVFVLPLYATAKHKGQCHESNGSQPVATYEPVTGSGTVSFSM